MADFRLDRLSALEAIVGSNLRPTQAMQRRWQVFCEKIEAAFDELDDRVTQLELDAVDARARARMDDLPAVVFTGDYTGALSADQLPLDIPVKRYDGTTNVSASSTWTATVESGDVTCSIGAATGVLNVTAIGRNSVVKIESTKDGLTLRKKQVFTISLAAPPNTGSTGGTSWTDTTLSSFNSTTMAAVSDELIVTVGPSGQVDLSAPLTVSTAAAAPTGVFRVWGIWQWWDGAAWQDLGTEWSSAFPYCTVSQDIDAGTYSVAPGSFSVPASKSGLVPAASEKFRLQARNDSGTRTMTLSGTATATSS